MDMEIIFGQRLKQMRKQKGYTQEQLALEIDLSAAHLRNMEHGKGNPTLKTMQKLCTCLGTTLGWMVGEETGVR